MAGTISNLSLPNAHQCLEFNKNLLNACIHLSVKHILWLMLWKNWQPTTLIQRIPKVLNKTKDKKCTLSPQIPKLTGLGTQIINRMKENKRNS